MKTNFLLFYFLISGTIVLKGQNIPLESFKIVAVNFGIRTIIATPCAELENYLSTECVTKYFKDSAKVFQLGQILNKKKFCKKSIQDINVRAKVYLDYGAPNSESVLCIDKFYDIELNGRLLKRNKKLIYFLKQFLKSFE